MDGPQKRCNWCRKSSESLKKCMECKLARYCNKTCQKAAWPTHRNRCRSMKKVLVGQPDRLRENAALVKWVDYWREFLFDWCIGAFNAPAYPDLDRMSKNHLVIDVDFRPHSKPSAAFNPTGAGLLDDEDLREWWADGEEDSPTSRALLEEVLNGRRDNNSIHIFVRANSVSRRLFCSYREPVSQHMREYPEYFRVFEEGWTDALMSILDSGELQMGEVFKNYFVLRAYPLPDEVRAGKTDWELALQWFQDDKKKAQGLLPSLQLGQKQLLARRKQ